MAIGAIGNSAPGWQPGGMSQGPTVTRSSFYEGQIKRLQEKIQELKKNESMDPNQKQLMLEQYQQQIRDLKSQQAQEVLDNVLLPEDGAQSADKLPVEPPPAEPPEEKRDVLVLSEQVQEALIQAQGSKEVSQTLASVRVQKEGERRWAELETVNKRADPAEAAAAAAAVAAIDTRNITQAMAAVDGVKSANTGEETAPAAPEDGEDAAAEEILGGTTGTGRMGLGQYLDDQA